MKFILSIFFTTILFAQNSGLSFLERSNSSRANSLGNIKLFSPELLQLNSNPSIFCIANTTKFQYSNTVLPFDANQSVLSYNLNSKKYFYALNFISHNLKNIEVRETPGEKIGDTKLTDYKIGTTFGYTFDTSLAIGVNLNLLHENLFIESANGYSIDFGIYRKTSFADFAFAINNLGKMDRMNLQNIKLPLIFLGGIKKSYSFNGSENSVFLETHYYNNNHKLYTVIGNEVNYNNLFFRVGNIFGNESKSYTFGFGIKFLKFVFDYSFVPHKFSLGDEHSMTVSILK